MPFIFFAGYDLDLYSQCLIFYNSKTYPFASSERSQLYRPIEEGRKQWTKTFDDEFFEALYRFFKIENTGKSWQHPLYFAGYINLLVYSLIPINKAHLIPRELKILRTYDNPKNFSARLHQYFGDEARQLLIKVIARATEILNGACIHSDDLNSRKAWLKQRVQEISSGQIPLNLYSYWSNNKQLKGAN